MQNRHENSTNNASGAVELTTGPGNGLIPQLLRNDDIKVYPRSFDDDAKLIITDNPGRFLYKVTSDSMAAENLHEWRYSILYDDKFQAKTSTVDDLLPGKAYIVTDIDGNVYLTKINVVQPGQALRLHFLNPLYPDILLLRNQVTVIFRVYQLSRQVISDERLDELCRIR